ncbi:MAG: DNA polymerase IV [Acidobacteria bacterium]|nr:DNA polymerase IV [Acidobacteriota bacterium]
MEREIIYMTVANFPVAVERVVHPALRGRPVVVAHRDAARSVVASVSAEARTEGICPGMALSRAMRFCRGMIVLPPDEMLYARASRAIFRVLAGFSPLLEPSGHGHAYLDITGTGRLFGPPRDTAWRAQKEIRRQLRLDASLGVASNKLVSRIASEVIQPDGLRDVPHGDEPFFLSPLPVRLLPGVGPKTEEQLADLNLRIIRDVAAMRMEHLALAFGRFGFALHQHARGIDRTPVYPMLAVPSVEEAEALPEDSNDADLLKRVLRAICERAALRLREQRQRAGRMELCVQYADHREGVRKVKIAPPLQSSAILYTRALALMDRVLQRRTRVRRVCLRLEDFSAASVQMELFAGPAPERCTRLELALDTLRHRYGEKAVVHVCLSI